MATEMWTASDVRLAALRHLGIVGAGEAASGDDDDLANDAYQTVYAELHRKGHAPFLADEVPQWAQWHLAKVVAGEMLGAFGFTGNRYSALRDQAKTARKAMQSGSVHVKPQADPGGVFF